MAVVLVDVIFFVLLVLGMLWLTICTRALDRCFYSFHTTRNNGWKKSDQNCQRNGGNLVSMETEEEYQFINETIQSLNVSDNEWYIGLTKEKGTWAWINHESYTLVNKWLKHEPSKTGYCVKMIQHYEGRGLFDDIRCSTRNSKMFICEYKIVTSGLERMIVDGIFVCNHTCFDNNNAKKEGYCSSVRPTSKVKNAINATTHYQGKEIRTTSEHMVQPTTSLTLYTSTAPSSTRTSRKEQKFPIMLVVIVLAVLLAVCLFTFVGVFCWLRKKSGKGPKEAKSSSNSASRSVAQDQSDLRNANSGGVQIVNEDKVHYIVPVDDIDYPRTTTNTGARDTDLSTYADVHDAIQPSAKLTSKYYDDEDLYLNPIDTAPTSDAQFYASVDLDSKPLQDAESKYEKEYPELKELAVIGRPASCSSMDATSEPSSSLYYATTDLSKPNKAIFETSKQGEEQRCKDVTTEPISCNSLYATTDLCSKAYEDYLDHTQRLKEASIAPSFYNNLYESTELIHLQNKATNDGLEQDGKVYIKEEKPRDCQDEASNGAKRKSRHPSIGSIMSASRKSKDKPSIPTPHKVATDDTIMYAMLDLLNNDKEMRPVYAQVNKKHKQ